MGVRQALTHGHADIRLQVIMDGNGRWAAARKQPVMFGHDSGVRALKSLVECCTQWKIPYLTVRRGLASGRARAHIKCMGI